MSPALLVILESSEFLRSLGDDLDSDFSQYIRGVLVRKEGVLQTA